MLPEQRDEVEMLALMLLIRRFEERASQQYQAQKIGGFCHLYIGQEAVVCGAVLTGSSCAGAGSGGAERHAEKTAAHAQRQL